MMSDAPTAYALALEFDLVDRPARCARRSPTGSPTLVREGGYRIGTGFVGTPLVTDALTDGGHLAAAERLLLQTECPSWLYPVTMGATTVWERWDSLLPDGSVNPGEMTSFNHYALGAVADWLHRTVAGLAPAAPGYARAAHRAAAARRTRPRRRPATSRPTARHRSRGTATAPRSSCARSCPPNTTAVVELPGDTGADRGRSSRHARVAVPDAGRGRATARCRARRHPSPTSSTTRAPTAPCSTRSPPSIPATADAVRAGTVWGAGRDRSVTAPHVHPAATCSTKVDAARARRRHHSLTTDRSACNTRTS